MPTATETLRFALRQGPLRGLLQAPIHIVEPAPTTSTIPPVAARGGTGRPLPFGTAEFLAGLAFPDGHATGAVPDRLGHLLLTAFGLQRREPSNPANDHRTTASVRSRFPVHVLVVPDAGPAGYLDLYRHALVDLAVPEPVTAPLRPEPGGITVVLAGRHTDFPDGYGVLRCALADLEVGMNLRSLAVAAQLFGTPAAVQTGGAPLAAAADLLAATGPGSWSAPALVTLRGAGPLPAPVILPDPDRPWPRWPAGDPGLAEIASMVDDRYAVPAAPDDPVPAIPGRVGNGRVGNGPVGNGPALPGPAGDGRTWERVLWDRTAGRVPAPLTGFSARPVACSPGVVDDLLAWARVPAPPGLLRDVASRVHVRIVVQHVTGMAGGSYRATVDGLAAEVPDPDLCAALEQGFGYPLSATNDCALRHAAAVCVWSVDLAALVRDLGPPAWGLLQVGCGWAAHGVTLAAAAHRLFARPARSFDEHLVAAALRLPPGETPVFLAICGRSRYAEPMLDLRT